MDEANQPPEWIAAMRDFYQRVDAALAERNIECRGCGECCHFDVVDHILYASELERRFLCEAAHFPENPDATPDQLAQGLRCPYQTNNRCHARNGRVLGCRLHFCDWADSAEEMDFAETWHTELKRLHATLGVNWDYRPLLPQ